MRLRNLARLALFSAVSMLTACGSSAPRQTEPMPWRPAVLLPAELAARCQPVVRPIDDSDAAAAVALRRCTACTAPAQASTWTPSTTSTSRGRIGEDRIGSLAAHHAAAGIFGPAQALEGCCSRRCCDRSTCGFVRRKMRDRPTTSRSSTASRNLRSRPSWKPASGSVSNANSCRCSVTWPCSMCAARTTSAARALLRPSWMGWP